MRFIICLGCIVLMLMVIQTIYPMEYMVDWQNPQASDQNVGTTDNGYKTFGEGGIVAPTKGDGYMKLESIRQVFMQG